MQLAPRYGLRLVGSRNRPRLAKQSGNSQICICHHCGGPTFFAPNSKQIPGAAYGTTVAHIPAELDMVNKIYEEARTCYTAGTHTAAVLSCRKLLMHVAVSLGAKEGLAFTDYVQYYLDEGYLPQSAKEWVDKIRKRGNEANHKVVIMAPDASKELLDFSEMLLKIIYEYPAKGKGITSSFPTPAT